MSEPMTRVQKAVTAHRRAQQRAEEALAELHDAIREAAAAGVRQVDLVRVTGYTRERIRQLGKP